MTWAQRRTLVLLCGFVVVIVGAFLLTGGL